MGWTGRKIEEMKRIVRHLGGNDDFKFVKTEDETFCVRTGLAEKIGIEDLVERISHNFELVLLYYHAVSCDTDYGRSVCAYSSQRTGLMERVEAVSDGTGKVDCIVVTGFTSKEKMFGELKMELENKLTSGYMIKSCGMGKLLADFS